MAIHLRASDVRRMPWKNGRGTTLEIATDARHAGDPWTWRLSIADVPESGPFSRFEGCDRLIACLEGDGMRLQSNKKQVDVPSAGEALRFSGDDETTGQLRGGPCRDVNLIARRDRWRAVLSLFRGDLDASIKKASTAIVHVIDGAVTVEQSSGVGYDVATHESLVWHDAAALVRGTGVVAIATLQAVAP